MARGNDADFDSLSRAVAALEKKARRGARKERPSGGIAGFAQPDYDSVSFFDLLARATSLESMLGKRTITREESEREMAALQSRLISEAKPRQQKPIKEPQKFQLDEIYSMLPKKLPEQQQGQPGAAGQKKEGTQAAQPQYFPAMPSKKRDDVAIVPEDMLGDVELARKEIKLSDAERQIAELKAELARMKQTKDLAVGAESEKIKKSLEAERKKEMEGASRKIALLTKSLEDDYERKLAREIAKIRAAKSDSAIASAQAAGTSTLSQLESYLSANPPRKKGLAQAFNSLKGLLRGKNASASGPAQQQPLQKTFPAKSVQPELPSPAQPGSPPGQKPAQQIRQQPSASPYSQPSRKQAEDIEKMREDFERKSREIRQLLKKKGETG